MLTGVPLDRVGVVDGACRLPELLEELLEEPELPDDVELPDERELPDEPELWEDFELPEELECPERACELPDGLVTGTEECRAGVLALAEACVAPGSSTATAPAAATLATEMAAVVLFSNRRPRSRSATARDMAGGPVGNCRVSMLKA